MGLFSPIYYPILCSLASLTRNYLPTAWTPLSIIIENSYTIWIFNTGIFNYKHSNQKEETKGLLRKKEKKKRRRRERKHHENRAVDFILLCTQWVHALDWTFSHHSIPYKAATINPILYMRKLRPEEIRSCPSHTANMYGRAWILTFLNQKLCIPASNFGSPWQLECFICL